MTLNQIRKQLIEFFKDHAQVNSVIWMDEDDFIAQRDTTYPVVNMEWLDTSLSDRFLQHRFRVLIGDLYNPNVTGIEDEIYSDCVQIAGDFWSWLQENMDFNFQSSSNIQKFTDDTGDRISGITFTITISVPNSWDECAIPKKKVITTSTTTTTTTQSPYEKITLTFIDGWESSIGVYGDINNVDTWNYIFDLPNNGVIPCTFIGVNINNNVVELLLNDGDLIGFAPQETNLLISVVDTGCCYSIISDCFNGCVNLTNVDFPTTLGVGSSCFSYCTSLTSINLPSLIAPNSLGGSVDNDDVFNGISGNTISLTIPSAFMTNNGGSPDGDIQYLQANNTVTITTV